MDIQRQSEVVELTGWDFYTYWDQPRYATDQLLLYKSIKQAVQEEKSKIDQQHPSR